MTVVEPASRGYAFDGTFLVIHAVRPPLPEERFIDSLPDTPVANVMTAIRASSQMFHRIREKAAFAIVQLIDFERLLLVDMLRVVPVLPLPLSFLLV